MSSLKEELGSFINKLEASGKHKLFRYLYSKASGFNPEKDTVFYSGPYWDHSEIIAAMESLLGGKWLATGENVHKFEAAYGRKFQLPYNVMVNSGSSANLVMISALKKVMKWQDGDEIIVSVVGFPTTLNPIIQNKLTPIFVDINMSDLNWDVEQVVAKFGPKTKAVFLSPVLGNPGFKTQILIDACKTHGVEIILDNCDSLGTTWDSEYLTQYAIASSTSFYPSHHITTGEGGMVSSHNKDIIDEARSFAWWGRDCWCVGSANTLSCGTCGNRFDKWLDGYEGIIDHKYIFTNIGYNLKPLDLQGAIGLVQLEKFDEIHAKRKDNKRSIERIIKQYIPNVVIPRDPYFAEVSWFGVPIICPTSEMKGMLVKHLEENRVQTRNYFSGNILMHPAYKHLGNYKDYPEACNVLERVFFIGCPPHFGYAHFSYIEGVLQKFVQVKKLPILSM